MKCESTEIGKNLTFRAPGDLLSTNSLALRIEADALLKLEDARGTEWSVFVLDLRAARMVDSVGLNVIVTLLRRVQKKGRRMRVECSSPNVFRTFTFTRLDQLIELVQV